MAHDAKRAQKAAEKRKQRERLVKMEKARKKTASQGQVHESSSLLASCQELTIWESVVSRGWRERGLAHLLVARERADGALLVGGYFVDFWCVGLKACAVIPRVEKDEYIDKIRSNIFNDPVEFEPIEPGVALALVEGSIAYAEALGFRANRHWAEARNLFRGIIPQPEGLTFGLDGKPCLVLRDRDNQVGAKARLQRHFSEGEFLVVDERGQSSKG